MDVRQRRLVTSEPVQAPPTSGPPIYRITILVILALALAACDADLAAAPEKCGPPDEATRFAVEGEAGVPIGPEEFVVITPGTPRTLRIHVTVFSGARLDDVIFEVARPGEGWPASPPVWSQRGGAGIDPGDHTMTVTWDGSNDMGERLPPGDYLLYVSADVRVTAEPEHPCDPAVGATSNEGHSLTVLRVGG